MLQDYEKRIVAASAEVAVFNDVELPRQSKRPHAVGKQSMRLDQVVISIDRFFVFLIPLARGLLTLGCVKLGKWRRKARLRSSERSTPASRAAARVSTSNSTVTRSPIDDLRIAGATVAELGKL